MDAPESVSERVAQGACLIWRPDRLKWLEICARLEGASALTGVGDDTVWLDYLWDTAFALAKAERRNNGTH